MFEEKTRKIDDRTLLDASVDRRGKTLPEYSPSMDMGGFVIIINAEKVQVGGAKEDQKIYYRHSGRPGGLKQETFRQLQAVHLFCLFPDACVDRK